MKPSDHASVVRGSLTRILHEAGFAVAPVNAFTDWPMLEQVALRFIDFVSPWLVVGGQALAETTLRKAIAAYDRSLHQGYEVGHRKFIETVAESAKVLASLRVSVMDRDGLWAIWDYDEPLMKYLATHKRFALQIREREQPAASAPVMIKLLAAIISTQQLAIAELDLPTLLNIGASK